MSTNTKFPLLYSLFSLIALSAHAKEFECSEIGLRAAVDGENRVDIYSYEVFATVESPLKWSISDTVELDLGFEVGIGALDGEGETAIFGHIGPAIEIESGNFPLELIIYSGPALLSEHEFDRLDLGGSFQFMSAIGFDFEVCEDWTLGYRFQHISNAGLHEKNPGLNLHSIGLSYDF